MKIDVIVDEKYKETEVKIYTSKRDEEVDSIIRKIEQASMEKKENIVINAYIDKVAYRVKISNVNRFYTELGSTYVSADGVTYKIKNKLYELEEKLKNTSFVRISKSEIINVDKILKIDMSFVGTIQVYFIDGSTTYVSRRFIKKVKRFLMEEKGSGKNEKSND